MNIEALRLLAEDADVKLDGQMLKFAELVIERCAIIAERRAHGEAIASRIRTYFEIDEEPVERSLSIEH